jgi:DNA-binding Lrp family transcriptional regulator
VTEHQPLDRLDLKILGELQQNGRIRNNELAERVGISAPPCLRRVRSLLSGGFIRAIRAALNERLLGYEVTSFVLIQLTSQARTSVQAFEAAIAENPLVLQCWQLSGDSDFLLKCVARSVEGMHQQLLQFSAMPDVRTIRTYPVLGMSKDGLLPLPADLASAAPAEAHAKA